MVMMQPQPIPEEYLDRDTRMTLLRDEVLAQYGGKLKAGTVVIVPAQTAKRWRERGIAVDSAVTDKTVREQKLAEIERLRAEVEAIPDEGVYDQAITRGDEATPATVTRPGRR